MSDIFTEFPSIHRLMRDVIVTEKLDGTNASVHVLKDGRVLAGSRARFITPEQDNYGFAKWVKEHEDELREGLGLGVHFGEWFGAGIQRRYGLSEKRFALFNVGRWWSPTNSNVIEGTDKMAKPPACCHVVPVIGCVPFDSQIILTLARGLQELGSIAAPGFMQPEGIVVYHTKSRQLYKYTFDKNDGHKSERASKESTP